MTLVGHVADLLSLLQLFDDVRVTGRRKEGRKPVEPGNDAVLDFARRHLARPADHRRHAESALQYRALALREWRLPAIGPGEDLGAVVSGEDYDGVIIDAQIFELLHHDAD